MRPNPHLYEINARVFLRRLSARYDRELTIARVPEKELRALARRGFDLVWMMGVWERSAAARVEALRHPALRREYDKVLPGWTERDMDGSPYAVRSYTLDPALGREGELAELRSRLNRLGMGLLLDFVPNHLALDHPWTLEAPERFVRGTPEAVLAHRDWFFTWGGGVYLAHGRDPYFPPWTDTAQVNFFSPGLREALAAELEKIAGVADGVRCDMAMLGLNEVFERIWGGMVSEPRPATEFWSEAIGRVKARHPGFIFLGEVYWGFEPRLQGLGFDFAYDKVLYDKLRFCPAPEVREHLADKGLCQPALARFIENHDELRAATAFGKERSKAAAVVIATIPGMRLFHDGQLEGKRLRIPVQLVREPGEEPDRGLGAFYDKLLAIANQPVFHEGEWQLLEPSRAWSGNDSFRSLLVWAWRQEGDFRFVAVNYSPQPAQGRLRLPVAFRGEKAVFRDELRGAEYASGAAEVNSEGLYIALEPWGAHILSPAVGR